MTTPVAPDVADGSVDLTPLVEGGNGTSANIDYAQGSTNELLNAYPAMALVEVTTRSRPIAVRGSVFSALSAGEVRERAAPGDDGPFAVVRPATLEVLRTYRGELPACLDLAIPGGSTGRQSTSDPSFPNRLTVGGPLLALFSGSDLPNGTPNLTLLIPPQADGQFVLPFGDREPIDATSWTPPPFVPVTPAPGGIRPNPVEPGLP